MTTLLTIPQAARLIGVHKTTLYRRVARGDIVVIRGMEDVRRDGKEGRLNIALIRRDDLPPCVAV